MLNRVLRPQSNSGIRYFVLVLVLIGLFVASFFVGNLLNAILQSPSQSISNNTSQPTSGAVVDPPHLLQDFTLTSQTGEPISLSSLRGRAVLMFFGYTHCPDECPTTLANYTLVKQAVGDEANRVRFVFISVDGRRDTPDVLTRYLGQFDADFVGMTGDEATMRQIGQEYGLLFQQETNNGGQEQQGGQANQQWSGLDPKNYFVQHTSPSFLVDPDGYLRMVYFYGTRPETLAQGIREILHK
jgi:protein SCO1